MFASQENKHYELICAMTLKDWKVVVTTSNKQFIQ